MTPIQHLSAVEAEKDILNLMISKPDETIPKVQAELVADDLYREVHKPIFTTLLAMYNAHEQIDITTLTSRLHQKGELERIGGVTNLTAIYIKSLSPGSLDTYLDVVKDMARRRKAISLMDAALSQVADLSEELDLNAFQTNLAKIMTARYVQEESMDDIAYEFMLDITERSSRDVSDFCVTTGLPNLDSIIHGLRRQELIYLAARPSMGKSALAIQIAVNAALVQKKHVLYISLEMGKRQIFGRAVANLSMVNAETIMYDSDLAGKPEEYKAVSDAANALRNAQLYIRTQDVNTPQGIFNQAQQVQGKYGLDLIIIDHVHLMRSGLKGDSDNLYANMKHISEALKGMAMSFDIPILALAQLSRSVENRNDKRPMMSDLRDSGSLEQDADKLLMMYRESYYTHEEKEPDDVEVIVRKQRDGRLGVANMKFYKQFSMMTPDDQGFGGRYEDKNFAVPV